MSGGNSTPLVLSAADCPHYTLDDVQVINFFSFWLEGVVVCVIAAAGMVANALSAYILTR